MVVTWLLTLLLFCASGQQIQVDKTSCRSGDSITVRFSGFSSSSRKSCWVGLFDYDAFVEPGASVSGALLPLTSTAPLKYIPCSKDDTNTFSKSGVGSKSFKIHNFANDLVFIAFIGLSSPFEVARSDIIQLEDKEAPSEVKLHRREEADLMAVTWTCRSDVPQYVQWGYSSTESLPQTTPSFTPTRYSQNDMCGGIARDIGWRENIPFHFQTIIGPFGCSNSKIYYTVGSNETGWTARYSFNNPYFDEKGQGRKFVLLADTGTSEEDGTLSNPEDQKGANPVRQSILSMGLNDVDLIVHIGDLAYARGYQSRWVKAMQDISSLARNVPMMLSWGNHERAWPNTGTAYPTESSSAGDCATTADHKFFLPGDGSDAKSRGYYAFTEGPARIVIINTEMNVAKKSDQWYWLDEELSLVNRDVTPWVFVFGHRPYYTATGRVSKLSALEGLFTKYKVDIFFAGHLHYYMRSCPVSSGSCQDGAPTYILLGTGGADLAKSSNDFDTHVVTAASSYGHCRMELDDTFVTVTFYSTTNKVADSLTLYK